MRILAGKEFVEIAEAYSNNNSLFVSSVDSLFKYKNSVGTISQFTNRRIMDAGVSSGIRDLIRQLIDRSVFLNSSGGEWAEAYIDDTGRLNSVTSNTASFDVDKFKTKPSTDPYIVIEATDLTTGDFAINDCQVTFISTGKWVLYCDTGTSEVQRAQMMKTLFYGEARDGSYSSAGTGGIVLRITGLTALKTNVTRDVGKRAHIVYVDPTDVDDNTDSYGIGYATLTFDNTSNNNSCSSWSNLHDYRDDDSGYARWEHATDNTVHSITGTQATQVHSNEIGLDMSADESDNPTSVTARSDYSVDVSSGDKYRGDATGLVLGYGDVTFTSGVTNSRIVSGASHIDYYTDNSVPAFETVDTISLPSDITHTLPTGTFSATINGSIGAFLAEDWESGDSVQYKLTNAGGDDSGWLNSGETSSFTAFTAEPDYCIVRLFPKVTSPTTGYPSINGFGVVEL